MDAVMIAAAVLLMVVGAVLIIDLARVSRLDPSELASAERAQLLTGVVVIVFAGSFLLARGGEDDGVPQEGAVPVPAQADSAVSDDAAGIAGLATAARLPDLRVEGPRRPERRRPERAQGRNQEQPAEPQEPTTTTTPTTTPAAPTTTPAPAPEPAPPPADDSVPFESRE